MLARRLTRVVNNKLCGHALLRDNSLHVQTTRAYGIDHEKIMYNWREKEADLNRAKPTDDPNISKKILWHPTAAPKESDFSLGNLVNWWKAFSLESDKASQSFIPKRHEILGPDLATAQFLVVRGARVKFHGNDKWFERDEKNKNDLPTRFDPTYMLEAIDINGFDLHYEGLSNICGLPKLKWLSLKDCKNIDDWGLDKISAEYIQLEYLDISGCNISERGLESLYRMFSLKKLITTNHHKSVAFDLTCMMLEDCLPGLTCEILKPEEEKSEQ